MRLYANPNHNVLVTFWLALTTQSVSPLSNSISHVVSLNGPDSHSYDSLYSIERMQHLYFSCIKWIWQTRNVIIYILWINILRVISPQLFISLFSWRWDMHFPPWCWASKRSIVLQRFTSTRRYASSRWLYIMGMAHTLWRHRQILSNGRMCNGLVRS